MITPQEALQRTIEHREIFHDEMLHLMRQIMQGEISPLMVAAILTGLRVKKETIGEISAAAMVMRELSTKVDTPHNPHFVDIVGTGGDGAHTFNISTASMFVAAAAGFAIASDGYSPAVTMGFNLQRYMIVFGPGSGHARHDDILTDFRALDARNILIVRRKPPQPDEYAPYFDHVEVRAHEIEGARFHFVEGRGFRFGAYRDAVLDEARRRWYAVPSWLPSGPCYFCNRYFPERACHR